MSKMIERLVKEIEAFCRKHKMAESRFGREACRNSSAVSRLRSKAYSSRMVSKIETYLEEHK